MPSFYHTVFGFSVALGGFVGTVGGACEEDGGVVLAPRLAGTGDEVEVPRDFRITSIESPNCKSIGI